MEITNAVSSYTVILSWDETSRGPFEVAIASDSQMKNVVLREKNIAKTEFRAALCPNAEYWGIVRNDENKIGTFSFATQDILNLHDASPLEKFAPARINSKFAVPFPPHINEPLPIDGNAPLSPWYCAKEYDAAPPPSFGQVRGELPSPIFGGDENASMIGSYWRAWEIAFDVWLFEPQHKDQAAFNLNGCPFWGEFGSCVDMDAYYSAQYYRYAHGVYPYIKTCDNIYARQHENGLINKESDVNNYEVYSSSPTMPTAMAWAEWENYMVSGDKQRLADVLLPLVKLYEWFQRYQRYPDGRYFCGQAAHGDWSITANAFQALSARCISNIAGEIGRHDLRDYFLGEFDAIGRMINEQYWDEKGEFYNLQYPDGTFSTRPAEGKTFKWMRSFDALMAGVAPAGRADAMIRHMLNPGEFMGRYGIRSLSLDSNFYIADENNVADLAEYDPFLPDGSGFGINRLAAWAPTMICSLIALGNYGYIEKAEELAERFVRGLAEGYEKCGDIKEFSWADKAEMAGNGQFCGWSGYGPISGLIEYVLGFAIDAPKNIVYWNIHQTARHGIERLRFGDATADFLCEERQSRSDTRHIAVATNKEFTLVVKDGKNELKKLAVKPGAFTFQID